MKRVAVLAALSLACTSVAAAGTVAIVNGRILTMGPQGEIARGTVVIRDRAIAAVGADVAIPDGARIIDARGGIVTPGFVAPANSLGIVEIRHVEQTDDRASASASLTAAFDVSGGFNPDSVLIPVARLGGLTRVIVTPGYRAGGPGNLFAGQAALAHLGAGADPIVKSHIGMVVELGETGAARLGGARGATLGLLRAALDAAKDYRADPAAHLRRPGAGLSRADLEALGPVVEGRMPLIATAHRAADIRALLKLAREYRLKLILHGAAEAWRVADELAAARVPVVLDASFNQMAAFETIGATQENAARLHRAGVLFAIEGHGPHRARDVRVNAGIAVANGLPWDAALRAITVNPARIFGFADRFGTIEKGKDADLVIWDGDPLEPLTQPQAVFVLGREQSLTSRARLLAERYRQRPGPYPPSYR